jgi:hypothetical protein
MPVRRAVIVPRSRSSFDPWESGRPAWCLAMALVQLGWSVDMMTTSIDPVDRTYPVDCMADPAGYTVVRTVLAGIAPLRLAMARTLANRGPYDLVAVTQPGQYGHAAIQAARSWGARSLVYVTGTDVMGDLQDAYWAPFVAWPLIEADHVVAATAMMAQIGRQVRKERPIGVLLEPSPVVPGHRQSGAGREPAAMRIGVIGGAIDGSDLSEVLTAFGTVHDRYPAVRLVLRVAPTQPVLRHLADWAKAWPHLAGAIETIPVGDDGDLSRFLATCDQVWVPMRHTTSLGPILAAMAAGVPLIAADGGAVGEVLKAGLSGQIVPPGQADFLAAAALRIVVDPAWARQCAETGQASVPAATSPAGFAASLADILAKMGLSA